MKSIVKAMEEGVRLGKEEQKPTQTSNEREYIRALKSIVSDFIRDKKPEDVSFYQEIYDWLDGRHVEQRPAEWSEEDEMHLKNAILAAENEWGVDSCTATWLKHLRPQPHWEPSGEQMDALQDSIDLDKTVFRRHRLVTLLDDLKKQI